MIPPCDVSSQNDFMPPPTTPHLLPVCLGMKTNLTAVSFSLLPVCFFVLSGSAHLDT